MRKTRIPLAILISSLLAGCASTSTPPVIEPKPLAQSPKEAGDLAAASLRDQGIKAYTKGDFARAVSLLEPALALDPSVDETWLQFILFYCHFAIGNYQPALEIAVDILKEKPYEPLAYQQAGLAELWLDQPQPALRHFRKAIEFEGHSPSVHFHQGLAEAKLGKPKARDKAFEEAEKEYLQILSKNPGDVTANYELAALYLFWGQRVEKSPALIAAARAGLLKTPNEELALDRALYVDYYLPVLEGVYAFRTADYLKAREILTSTVGKGPAGTRADQAEIYFYLARTYQGLNDTATSKRFFEKSLSLDPSSAFAKEIKGAIREIASRAQ